MQTNNEVYNLLQYKEVQVIGSANNDMIKYPSDIDLEEHILTEQSFNDIYRFFLNMFQSGYKKNGFYIVDFKCGKYKGKPIKWSFQDMKNGYVTVNKLKIPFNVALSHKSTIKVDAIVSIKNIYREYSVNYYFDFQNQFHKNVDEYTTKQIENMLLHNYQQLLKQGKDYKALKRLYSYYTMGNREKEKKQLEGLFNSQLGVLYKQKSSLETIDLLINNKFKPPNMERVNYNLELIKKQLPKEYHSDMDKLIKAKRKNISKLVDKLDVQINQEAKEWKDKKGFVFVF